jgi:hypothetical protein
MNTASHAPSPDLEATDVPELPRKKSIPPPLPRRDSAPSSSDFPRAGSAAGGLRDSMYPVLLSPTTAHEPALHHRLSPWAELILIGGAALLVTPMVIGSHAPSGEPSMFQAGVPASKARVVPSPQVVELDEILILGALYDKPEVQENPHFDRTLALSAIRSVTTGPDDCGPAAVGSVNVVVTFATSGDATTAEIDDGPLRGTQTGNCIARRLRHASVAEFDGEPETVRTSIELR